ncbi:hypothetical protein ISN44_As13g009400 [Arabidopsis suecica]|uniref:Uncharacterized protein n=1 Tax=Arabidopsis suecica TaxID=45249 RepID=A0A8T1XYL7_ARASU|nr:hypothetical protein ISN44_As13g009400 [Arabidopsis suecica]
MRVQHIGHVRCSVASDPNKRPEISCKYKGFVIPECGEHAAINDYGDAATIFSVAGKSSSLFSTQRQPLSLWRLKSQRQLYHCPLYFSVAGVSRELEDQGDSESGSSRTINLLWDAIEEMIRIEFDGRRFTVNGFVLLCFWFNSDADVTDCLPLLYD